MKGKADLPLKCVGMSIEYLYYKLLDLRTEQFELFKYISTNQLLHWKYEATTSLKMSARETHPATLGTLFFF